jgi:hypothetical protein
MPIGHLFNSADFFDHLTRQTHGTRAHTRLAFARALAIDHYRIADLVSVSVRSHFCARMRMRAPHVRFAPAPHVGGIVAGDHTLIAFDGYRVFAHFYYLPVDNSPSGCHDFKASLCSTCQNISIPTHNKFDERYLGTSRFE